tara:strand:+ start:24086 stop:26449 length:2364 start_codon:yes stop_codon:yes gene_type:complete
MIAALNSSVASAELTMASLFCDGAVLQRDASVPVWGTADANTEIHVSFAGQTKTAKSSDTGQWRVNLDPIPASSEPRELKITGDKDVVSIANVLVGDVWLCSGQSNMAMRVDLARDAEMEKADSDLPELRVFSVENQPARNVRSQVTGSWVTSSPDSAGRFSACAFFFGRELHRHLDIPIGLVVTARSGSDIAAWISPEAQHSEPALENLLASWSEKDAAYTPEIEAAELAKYEQALAAWKTESADAIAAGKDRPKKPRQPVNPRDHWHHPYVLYNGMLAPLIPYAIRGGIWYQGETNAFTEETSALYETQLRLLIKDWRNRWGQGDFPFAWVQLPFTSAKQVAWARIRESMRRATAIPNTGMVVTLDLGEERLLHPKNKQAYAHRLALWARANVYGEEIQWSGPMFTGQRVGERSIVVRFDHADGLASKDGTLTGFEIRDSDQNWHVADARIQNDRVVLRIPETIKATAFRYAWANHPDGNLVNSAGLPASPFMAEISGDETPANASAGSAKSAPAKRKKKGAPADLTKPPLDPADLSAFPDGTQRLDIYLLMGQSNMKGRGVMPSEPLRDRRIVMMHLGTDGYYLARHPLHLTGDPADFSGADNAGVGPGLDFAQSMVDANPNRRILLVPCAVGGTQIASWQKGAKLYERAVRRAKLAVQQAPQGKSRIAGALWLQGEADSNAPERIEVYAERLDQMIDDLRADLDLPELPFVACTIGELRPDSESRVKINEILLDLPNRKPHTACVDSRAYAVSIGDNVHFDTPTQQRHGRQYAELMLKLSQDD